MIYLLFICDLLPRKDGKEKDLKCINCGEPAIFEYMYVWIVDNLNRTDFCLCLECAKMIGSNIVQDVLRKEIDFKPLGNYQRFIEILKKKFS